MSTIAVDEIKRAIDRLTVEERAELERWLHGWTDDAWDNQITADAKSGKLDALLGEVDDEIAADGLHELP